MQGFKNCFWGLVFCLIAMPLLAQVEHSVCNYGDEYHQHGHVFMEVDANIKEQVALWNSLNEIQAPQMSATGDIEVIGHYQDGVAMVQYQGKYGFVNKYGQYIIAPEYQEAHWFCEGYAPVKYKGKWSFINAQGEVLTAFVYDYVGIFSLGLAAVQRDEKWGVINQKGTEVIVPQYDAIEIDKFGQISFLTGRTWRKWQQ